MSCAIDAKADAIRNACLISELASIAGFPTADVEQLAEKHWPTAAHADAVRLRLAQLGTQRAREAKKQRESKGAKTSRLVEQLRARGMSTKQAEIEAAAQIGGTPDSVRQACYRARKKSRNALQPVDSQTNADGE
ncbi:MAG: hypothetical protein JO006_12310 [Paucibacter sp.]|nr:hypothetical protein [Roseateles sp.]